MNAESQLMMKPIHAWMGGTRPLPLSRISNRERVLVSRLFRDQVGIYTGYWGDPPDYGICRLLWRRARYDAHATFRVTHF